MSWKRASGLFVVLFISSRGPGRPPADVVVQNGVIYTVNELAPRAEAVAITGARIVFVGSEVEVADYIGPATQVIDLRGATAVPGLTDSHYHLSGVGNRELTLNLEGSTSLEDFLDRVENAVALREPGEWVTARGWIEAQWPEPEFPTRRDLDRVSPTTRFTSHARTVTPGWPTAKPSGSRALPTKLPIHSGAKS